MVVLGRKQGYGKFYRFNVWLGKVCIKDILTFNKQIRKSLIKKLPELYLGGFFIDYRIGIFVLMSSFLFLDYAME